MDRDGGTTNADKHFLERGGEEARRKRDRYIELRYLRFWQIREFTAEEAAFVVEIDCAFARMDRGATWNWEYGWTRKRSEIQRRRERRANLKALLADPLEAERWSRFVALHAPLKELHDETVPADFSAVIRKLPPEEAVFVKRQRAFLEERGIIDPLERSRR